MSLFINYISVFIGSDGLKTRNCQRRIGIGSHMLKKPKIKLQMKLHLDIEVATRSTPWTRGKPFQGNQADPGPLGKSRSPSLQSETDLLFSVPPVESLGHYSLRLQSKIK